MELNEKVVEVDIIREEGKKASLIFKELENLEINLSDSSVEDIKILFNSIFDNIVEDKNLIVLKLIDEGSDLFHEVAEDIIVHLNAEIQQSRSDLLRIIDLNYQISQ